MKKDYKCKSVFRKAGVIVVGAALSASISLVPAFADTTTGSDKIPTGPVTTTSSYITGAASRAAGPAPEILGLASVEESGQFVNLSNLYNWSQPKYYLAASNYNAAVSPFLANLATGLGSEETQAVINASRNGAGAGPNAALNSSDETDAKVLKLADVVIGNGGDATSSAVAYKFSDYSGLVKTMYSIADAADKADAANDQKTLRFKDSDGEVISATSIAQNYEKYIFGTEGLIQKAIDTNQVSKRTVAVVTNAEYDKDDETWYFELMTTDNSSDDGTASVNRYLETTSKSGISGINLATNYGDVKSTEVTADDLANVDLLLVGGQNSSKNYSDIIDAIEADGLVSKTYAVKDNGSAGAMYGVVMNSVENAQNVGRILGMLYPTIVNQQNWMAYYYQTFYHINGVNLGEVMNEALTGVRCQAATQTDTMEHAQLWNVSEVSSSGVSGYTDGASQSTVQSSIDAGYAYFKQVATLS